MDRIKTAKDITPSNFFDEFQTYNRQERAVMAIKLMMTYDQLMDYRDIYWDNPFLRDSLIVTLTYIAKIFDIMHLPMPEWYKYRLK